ncbi:MAG: hypothetical protein WA733_10615 [Methylocystis sp.]|jgi:hypothetical protein
MTLLLAMRAQLYDVLPTREGNAYRASLGIDHATIEAECGVVVIAPVRYFPGRSFDLIEDVDTGGVLSAIIEVFDADARTIIDLVAWPLNRPDKFARALGRGDGLAIWRVLDPGTYAYSSEKALRVHRTPDSWLRAGCQGVVILNTMSAPRWLSASPGHLLAENIEHGREIGRLLHPLFDPRRILAPLNREVA